MANRTNKQNRTFSRTCSVCSSSAPHRTEPNNTLVRFVFGRISNIDTRVRFCSTRTRTEQYFCSVRVRQVRTTQSKAEHSVFLGVGIVDCWSNSWIGKSKQWLRNNGRGTMAEEKWPRNNGRGTMVGRTMTSLGSTNTAKSELSIKSKKPKTSHFLVILTHGRTIV